jgi:uncharacterized protein (DUF1778 family)
MTIDSNNWFEDEIITLCLIEQEYNKLIELSQNPPEPSDNLKEAVKNDKLDPRPRS